MKIVHVITRLILGGAQENTLLTVQGLHHRYGDDVTLVSSAEETAKDVYRVLADGDLLRPDALPPPSLAFSTTGDAGEFRRLARRFLGPEVETVFGNRAGAS